MQSFYREILLDHFEHPRNRHELEDADIHEHLDNPLCGDVVTVYAKVHDGTFEEVSFTGRGCSISQASASMLTEQLTGKSRDEAEENDRSLPRDDAHGGKGRARGACRPQGRRSDTQPHPVRHPRLGCREARSPRAVKQHAEVSTLCEPPIRLQTKTKS